MKPLIELNGRFAVPIQDHDGTWFVATAFLKNPIGGSFSGVNAPKGNTRNMSENEATLKSIEWDKFLASHVAGQTNEKRTRSSPASKSRRSR